MGKKVIDYTYTKLRPELAITVQERDLAVMVNSSL